MATPYLPGAMPSVPLDPLSADDPRQLGDFRLLGRLGAGGMGVAYLAEGPTGWVVVKSIWPHLASDRAFRTRLVRELDAMRAIDSPQVADVLAEDHTCATPWFAMSFVPGVSLRRQIEESGPLQPRELEDFAVGLATVLGAVERAGVIHRDLKPSNIMMAPDGPSLIDFGAADVAESTQLTQTGHVVGSAGWLAPEQITGEPITGATDVHAWALCVLYAATGASPFGGENTAATFYQVLHNTPAVPSTMSPLLASLVTSALSKDANRRPSIADVTNALRSEGAPYSGDAVEAGTVVDYPPVPAVVPGGKAVVAASPLVPGAAALPEPPTTVGVQIPAPVPSGGSRRRGPLLAVAGAAVAALVLIPVGMAIARSGSGSSTATAVVASPTVEPVNQASPEAATSSAPSPSAASPPAAPAKTATAITAGWPKGPVQQCDKLVVPVLINPGRAEREVVLQYRSAGGTWKDAVRSTTVAGGKARLSLPSCEGALSNQKESTRWRVSVLAAGNELAASTDAQRITVESPPSDNGSSSSSGGGSTGGGSTGGGSTGGGSTGGGSTGGGSTGGGSTGGGAAGGGSTGGGSTGGGSTGGGAAGGDSSAGGGGAPLPPDGSYAG